VLGCWRILHRDAGQRQEPAQKYHLEDVPTMAKALGFESVLLYGA
jgi:hypothetical protein